MNSTNFSNQFALNNDWGGIMEGLTHYLKSIVKQSMEEVIQDKMHENVVVDQNLTTKQLLDRWKISDTTLLSWEKQGRISPIKIGKKKLYSLKDVKEAEVYLNLKIRA